MCGIVAALHPTGAQGEPVALARAVASLAHRGPDRLTLRRCGPVSLGHSRLAIVDIRHGDQPLASPDGQLLLIANGEIYNAAEIARDAAARGLIPLSRSDNEAILLAYQLDTENFLRRLNGMFAFVLVDLRRRRLVIARDRLGIKPLFVHARRDRLLVASEIKALLQFPGVEIRPDATAIGETLTFGYPMGTRTAFAGIAALPPGHRLDAELDAADINPVLRSYWRPDDSAFAAEGADAGQAVERLRDSIERSVRSHLMGEADHLLYLSGGLDSSILAQLLVEGAPPGRVERALSLHFSERRFDESDEAAVLAARLGLALEIVEDRPWTLADLAGSTRALEQPQIVTLDLSMQSLSRAARARGCKFVLAGDGADELFGGYDHFGIAKGRDFAAAWLPAEARRAALEHILRSRRYPADFASLYLTSLEDSKWPDWPADDPRALPWHPIWAANDAIRRRLMPGSAGDPLGPDGAMAGLWRRLSALGDLQPIQRYVSFELQSRLPNWILLRSDRNAMANSIETRVPFLDGEVIDAALACPPQWVGAPLHEKLPLKLGFGDRLGQAVTGRAKRAFNTPHGWVFAARDGEVADLLAPGELARTGLFDPEAVAAALDGVTGAYSGGCQPEALAPVLTAQSLLGVVTTQLLFTADWRSEPARVEIVEAAQAAVLRRSRTPRGLAKTGPDA